MVPSNASSESAYLYLVLLLRRCEIVSVSREHLVLFNVLKFIRKIVMETLADLGLGIMKVTALSAVCLHVAQTDCVCSVCLAAFVLTNDSMFFFLNRTESCGQKRWTVSLSFFLNEVKKPNLIFCKLVKQPVCQSALHKKYESKMK